MKFVNRYFSLILLSGSIAGLFLPSPGNLTNKIVIISLACVIFSSFFQISLSIKSLTSHLSVSLMFCAARFILIPAIMFVAIKPFSHDYATIVLLNLLVPAAVSSPAFTMLFGGKTDLSLKILLFSSFLSIFSIPFMLALFSGSETEVPVTGMLITLVWTIFVPFILHIPLRKIKPLRNFMLHRNSLIAVIFLSVLGMVVTAKNKEVILGNPALIIEYTLSALVVFVFMYLTGYALVSRFDIGVRRALTISSGANNAGLGVTITALFFPGEINVFFIIAQFVWVLILIPVRTWLLRMK